MRESQVYLNFLKNNALLIFAPAVLLTGATAYYIFSQPTIFSKSIYLESKLDVLDLANRITLTEQMVGNLRSPNVQKQLGLTEVNMVIVKTAPLSLNIEVISPNAEKLDQAASILLPYVKEKYRAEEVGAEINGVKKPRIAFPLAVSLGIGLILGTTLSLIRLYFRNF